MTNWRAGNLQSLVRSGQAVGVAPKVMAGQCLALILVACSMGWTSSARAWNSTGHALVVQIAYDKLGSPTRKAFIALLQKHPRFEADFLNRMPTGIANASAADQQQWLFRRAGQWSDKTRQYGWWLRLRYNAPQWHFINYPLGVAGAGFEPAEDVVERGWWGRLPRDMNAVQAVQAHIATLKNSRLPKAQRALSLTWLCHIVGDLHQPLHATSLFTEKRFAAGDRGGNKISIQGQGSSRNLHALWDSLAGDSADDGEQQRRAARLAKRFPASELAESDSTDVKTWVQESVTLSRDVGYSRAILSHVNANERSAGKLTPVRISNRYVDAAREVAAARIALAGYRLAALLTDLVHGEAEHQ